MRLQTLGMDYYTQNYRFAFEKGEVKSLTESIKTQNRVFFSNVSDLNDRLQYLEKKGEHAAMLMNIAEQPKDIMELLKNVSGGKYFTFLQNNVEGIIYGRNLEELNAGDSFIESLGFSVNGSSAKAISEGKMGKIIAVDTYNSAFQNAELETQADEIFTEQTQTLSVFVNQLKQAYFINKGDTTEDSDTYEFLLEAVEDIESYLDNGNSLSFVLGSEEGIFRTSLSMMKDSINNYINENNNSDVGVFWHGFA